MTVTGAQAEARVKPRMLTLDLLCLDRPGIVRDVTETLTALEINIEEFESALGDAAFTGPADVQGACAAQRAAGRCGG